MIHVLEGLPVEMKEVNGFYIGEGCKDKAMYTIQLNTNRNAKLTGIWEDAVTVLKHIPAPSETINIGRYMYTFLPNTNKNSRGGQPNLKVTVLGRDRVITKVGRKSMITYKGKQVSLTEAREIERKIKSMKKP